MAFIETLNYKFDIEKIIKIYNSLPDLDQITINNRGDDPEDPLTCGNGGLQNWYEIKTYEDIKDKDFYWTYLNDIFRDTYMSDIYYKISMDWEIGRSRFMKLKPKQCYTFHHDFSKRIHIPIITNEHCKFFDESWNTYHMSVGGTYLLDTTQKHTTGNFSKEDRIHLVMAVK